MQRMYTNFIALRSVKIGSALTLLLAISSVIACSTSQFSGQSGNSRTVNVGKDPSDAVCTKGTAHKSNKKNLGLNGISSNCSIEANGDQARLGVYAVVLTTPAPCDFKLPSVTISSSGLFGGNSVKVPIGTYWSGLTGTKAHSFALTGTPANAPIIDNGFILIQPDGKSYLLADAGMALPLLPTHQSAGEIASQVSQSLGFGPTELLQPDPGSPSDNYATATVFKAGSVIAIYDDTPDMNGAIEVETLVSDAIPAEEEDDKNLTDKDNPDDNTADKRLGASESENQTDEKISKKKDGISEANDKLKSSDKTATECL